MLIVGLEPTLPGCLSKQQAQAAAWVRARTPWREVLGHYGQLIEVKEFRTSITCSLCNHLTQDVRLRLPSKRKGRVPARAVPGFAIRDVQVLASPLPCQLAAAVGRLLSRSLAVHVDHGWSCQVGHGALLAVRTGRPEFELEALLVRLLRQHLERDPCTRERGAPLRDNIMATCSPGVRSVRTLAS